MAHGAAHAAAMMNAIKASGVIVRVEPDTFARLVAKQEEPLVVRHYGGMFKKKWELLAAYRGFVFHTKAVDLPPLPGRTEYIDAEHLSVPE